MPSNDSLGLSIRPLGAGEIVTDAEKLELHTSYANMWAEEVRQKTITLLAAFTLNADFLGRLAIVWRAPDEPEIAQYLPGVPTIMAAYVSEKNRSQGVGTQLMLAAEKIVLDHGRSQLALGVEVKNLRGITFYERLGYKQWHRGDITISWTEHNGTDEKIVNETCHVMVKDISNEGNHEKIS